jgi:N-acetylmuramoyl-L-alanine amidase-like protein
MKLERRSSFGWGATPAPSAPCRNGIVVHYDGSNQGLADKSHSACRTYWSNTRRFHINTRGWLDIGYSAAVCPHGIVMEGRGFFRSQAAQPGGNTTWTSVTFMSGPSERPTTTQINAFRELRSWLRAQKVAAAIRGHRDFVSTSCPGNILYRMVQNGTLAGAPSNEPPEEEPLRIVVSLGLSDTVSVPAGERIDLRLGREFSDPDGIHAEDAHGVAPKDSAYYHVSAAVRLEGLPEGQSARLSFARFNKDEDRTFDRDMFAQTCAGVTAGTGDYQLIAVENLSKSYRYRVAIRNQSDTPITVASAYLKLAR